MQITYRQELLRKSIHLSSLWMPAAIYFLPRDYCLIIFAVLLVGAVTYEVLRRQKNKLGKFIQGLFKAMLREHEATRLSGAFYVILAALLATALFPTAVAVLALSIMLISDTAASLIGRRFGKRQIMGKSIAGAMAFLVSALSVVFVVGHIYDFTSPAWYAAVLAAIAATFVEFFASKIKLDDNLTITLTVGMIMSISTFLL